MDTIHQATADHCDIGFDFEVSVEGNHNKGTSKWIYRNRAVAALTDIGYQLLQEGQEDTAIQVFDAALSVLKSALDDISSKEISTRSIIWAKKKLERARSSCMLATDNPELEVPPPDVFSTNSEDECNFVPRPFHTPIFPPQEIIVGFACACSSGRTKSIEECSQNMIFVAEQSLEACILYNKALAYQKYFNHNDAAPLYEMIIRIALNHVNVHKAAISQSQQAQRRPYKSMHTKDFSYDYNTFLFNVALRAHNNLGRICYIETYEEEALSHFEEAVSFARKLGTCNMDHATTLSNLCRILWLKGDRSDILCVGLKDVLKIRCCHLGSDHVDVARAHYNLGLVEYTRSTDAGIQGKPRNQDEAALHLTQFLRICSKQKENAVTKAEKNTATAPDLDPIPALIYLLLLKNKGNDKNNATSSRELCQALRMLEEKRQRFGPNNFEVASALNYIGTTLFHRNDFDDALFFFQEELRVEGQLKITVKNRNLSTSVTCNNIARTLQELERFPEAIVYYKRALDCGGVGIRPIPEYESNLCKDKAKQPSESSSWTIKIHSTIWYNLGLIHDKMRAYSDAIQAFKQSLTLRKSILGFFHPDIACLLYNIAVLQLQQGSVNEAAMSIYEVLIIRRNNGNCNAQEDTLGTNSGHLKDQVIISLLQRLSYLSKSEGKIHISLQALQEVYVLQQSSSEFNNLGEKRRDIGITLTQLSELFHDQGYLHLAMATARESITLLKTITSPEPLASALLLLGCLTHENCDPSAASSIFMEAFVIIDQAHNSILRHNNIACPPAFSVLRNVCYMLATSYCAAAA